MGRVAFDTGQAVDLVEHRDYLNDILEKIADIGAFIEGMGYEDLETDK
jgi:uncharacterized protein with HEPN domain